LTVGNCGGTDEVAGTIAVECAPACQEPAGAGYAYTPTVVFVNAPVVFAGSILTGTAPFSYNWSFGDGSQGTGQMAQHVFTETGLFTVTMVVANGCGAEEWAEAVVVAPYRIYLPLVEK
jgi:PKD repeat protein